MNIAEKLIVNGNVGMQTKDDLAYLLINFKRENPGKRISQAQKIVEKALESEGYCLDDLDIELREDINFIRLEVNEKVRRPS
jgi:hypothetical protein